MPNHLNLLFIYTDQQAISTLGCYGNPVIETPNMDRLAVESVLFENCYVTQPLCTPSRASLLNGLYPHACGCTTNNIPLSLDIPCLPEIGDFRAYRTCHNGKWHLGDEIFPQHGFQEWIGTEDTYRRYWRPWRDKNARSPYFQFLLDNGFQPDTTFPDGAPCFSRPFCCRVPEEYSKPAFQAREAARYIREHAAEPFVLYVNFLEPHHPYFGCRDGQYPPADVLLPPDFTAYPTEEQPLKAQLMRRGVYEGGLETHALQTEADWRQLISNYWGNVSLVDTHMGHILAALDEAGLRENTIIVFTSDHGDMMGSHGMLGKCTMFEEAIKVPLMLHIPGVTTAGRRIRERVGQIDVVPTLLEALEQPLPDHLQGHSWLPWLRGEGELVEKNVYIEWGGGETGIVPGARIRETMPDYWREMATPDEVVAALTDPLRTIITPEGFKYTWSTLGDDELYNLNNDPYETENLAHRASYRRVVQSLREQIRDWQRRTGDGVQFAEG